MEVQNLMRQDVKTCRPQDSLNTAAQIFWDFDCGCVPVVDDDHRVLGILTDRDVCMAAYTQGKLLRDIPVSVAMNHEVFSCKPSDTIAAAERIMKENHLRRLPNSDNDGQVVGILSFNDIACEASRERTHRRKEVSDAEVGEMLGAICSRRMARQPIVVAS